MKSNDSYKIENMTITERLFFENEVKSNIMGTKALLSMVVLAAIHGVLAISGVLDTNFPWIGWLIAGCCAGELILYGWVRKVGYESSIAKVLILAGLIFISAITYFMYPLTTVFLIFGPTMVSIKYYDPKLTLKITAITWLAFVLAVAANVILEFTSVEIHNMHIEQGMILWGDIPYTCFYYVIPRTAIYVLEAFIGYRIAKAGRNLVLDQAESFTNAAVLSAELNAASQLQKAAMADAQFTTPDGNMSLFAGLRPAKDIGGDFYDHFMINDHLLVVAVADVSDKGLPAAMFGIEAQSYLRFAFSESFHKDLNGDVEFINLEIAMNAVNRQLSIHNMDGMFVTMWLGCFDTRTGVGKYVNAGHNLPYIKRSDGTLMTISNEPQFFMGAFENAELKPKPISFKTGDTLILYTDGITDARNDADETYGNERLKKTILDAADVDGSIPAETIRKCVAQSIDDFIGDVPPYDDMTMLTLSFTGEPVSVNNDFTLETGDECASQTMQLVNEILKDYYCPVDFKRNLNVIIDEVCTNISEYAYEGKKGPLRLLVHTGKNFISIRFIDEGIPFNPIEAEDPDIDGEPRIGGLGIYLVKNLADKMEYMYKDGKNILTVKAIWNM